MKKKRLGTLDESTVLTVRAFPFISTRRIVFRVARTRKFVSQREHTHTLTRSFTLREEIKYFCETIITRVKIISPCTKDLPFGSTYFVYTIFREGTSHIWGMCATLSAIFMIVVAITRPTKIGDMKILLGMWEYIESEKNVLLYYKIFYVESCGFIFVKFANFFVRVTDFYVRFTGFLRHFHERLNNNITKLKLMTYTYN